VAVQTTTSRNLGPYDVLVKITHSGLCGTDVHVKNQHVGLRHEGTGLVEDIGTAASLVTRCVRVDTHSLSYISIFSSLTTNRTP
jgi:D-arabinose 1-dehydrogenase-like Zn-dependent alcohol dehydrogenase